MDILIQSHNNGGQVLISDAGLDKVNIGSQLNPLHQLHRWKLHLTVNLRRMFDHKVHFLTEFVLIDPEVGQLNGGFELLFWLVGKNSFDGFVYFCVYVQLKGRVLGGLWRLRGLEILLYLADYLLLEGFEQLVAYCITGQGIRFVLLDYYWVLDWWGLGFDDSAKSASWEPLCSLFRTCLELNQNLILAWAGKHHILFLGFFSNSKSLQWRRSFGWSLNLSKYQVGNRLFFNFLFSVEFFLLLGNLMWLPQHWNIIILATSDVPLVLFRKDFNLVEYLGQLFPKRQKNLFQ